jgi:hypothetical protein
VPKNIVEKLEATAKNNFLGEVIKIMMITAAGAEGINLKNTRYVHIVEPYWHMVRLEQVIGRARRICSHADLPAELRTIQVFLYISTFSEAQKKDGLGDGVIDDTNLADSYGQIRPLDGCWSINQMQAEKEAGIARIFVIKHRHGKSRFTCYVRFDMKTLQIKQISSDGYDKIWKEHSFKKTHKAADMESQVESITRKQIKFKNDAGYEDPDSPDVRPDLPQETTGENDG